MRTVTTSFAGVMRRQLKRWMKGAGVLSGVLSVTTRPVILMYHSVRRARIRSEISIGSAITHSAAEFEGQMRLIAARFRR